jgi:hypothetical protein
MKEFVEKFDDEHQINFYCIGVLDGEGEDDRRTARLIAHTNATALNVAKIHGKPVDDTLYQSEDDYMPGHWKRDKRDRLLQPWDEMKRNLGFS